MSVLVLNPVKPSSHSLSEGEEPEERVLLILLLLTGNKYLLAIMSLSLLLLNAMD